MHVSLDEDTKKGKGNRTRVQNKISQMSALVVHSSYRSIENPIIRYVDPVSKNATKHNYTTTVIIPQFVPRRRWQNILHNQTSPRLRFRLSWREKHCRRNLQNNHFRK